MARIGAMATRTIRITGMTVRPTGRIPRIRIRHITMIHPPAT